MGETERKNLQQVRNQYANELEDKTQLELFLRQCVQDVKNDIAKERHELATRSSTPDDPRSLNEEKVNIESFQAKDRARVLELLLSKERVVSLLYTKTFQNSKQTQIFNHNQLPKPTPEEIQPIYHQN